MTLENIQFKQGVVKDGTRYTNKGGWYDSDKVRFRYGFPEKIGGWEKRGNEVFQGLALELILNFIFLLVKLIMILRQLEQQEVLIILLLQQTAPR